jgi:hypothetical protein
VPRAALRRLGLVAGDPDDRREPRPDAASLVQAEGRLLDAAEPLAEGAGALRPADDDATASNAGRLRTGANKGWTQPKVRSCPAP